VETQGWAQDLARWRSSVTVRSYLHFVGSVFCQYCLIDHSDRLSASESMFRLCARHASTTFRRSPASLFPRHISYAALAAEFGLGTADTALFTLGFPSKDNFAPIMQRPRRAHGATIFHDDRIANEEELAKKKRVETSKKRRTNPHIPVPIQPLPHYHSRS
jgi:hypothetical protein